MKTKSIQTSVFSSGGDLIDFIVKHIKNKITENSILAVTSKIVSLAEGRVVSRKGVDKKALIKKESDYYLGEAAYGCHLTIHQGLLIPSAGVDESNAHGDLYILYPKDPWISAKKIHQAVSKKFSLKNFGVLITDSRTLPLRAGTVGTALAYYGFLAVKDMVGKKDLFKRPLKMTKMNMADALAGSAVLLMGEGAERCPLALIHSAPVVFSRKSDQDKLSMPVKEDLYYPLYKHLLKSF